ncbi:SET domain-containing protein [Pleomassaria siparia CBS 279.74]|uniref:SET domain-containing protein n=1 Tax=Pleomassaria siparia CBS 279.74 TaxID=1314801 RepID=A0A6G1JZH8_9PLEO|nr:SET domain-containing protein [Pleomassaria siparia CBS 279.74]
MALHVPGQLVDIASGPQVCHGRGMIARKVISKGELILEDPPLIIINTRLSLKRFGDGVAFWKGEESKATRHVEQALQEASNIDRDVYRGLHVMDPNAGKTMRDIDIAKHNAYNFTWNKNVYLAVCQYVSRINHSCIPNSMAAGVRTKEGIVGSIRLVATKDILQNEEIFLEYQTEDQFWLQSAAVRMSELQQNWHFQCACPACHASTCQFYDNAFAHIRWLRAIASSALPDTELQLIQRINDLKILISMLLAFGFGDGRLSAA